MLQNEEVFKNPKLAFYKTNSNLPLNFDIHSVADQAERISGTDSGTLSIYQKQDGKIEIYVSAAICWDPKILDEIWYFLNFLA